MQTRSHQHGVLVRVEQCGVLITGPAGSGKSQLGLELISRGHNFVGDDLLLIERRQDTLHGRGVDESAEFLALRCGLVVAVARQHGPQALCPECQIDLVVTPGPALTPLSPLPQHTLLGLARPLHYLHSLPGSAVCVEALARDWQDQAQGYNAAQDLQQRQQTRMEASA